jgi:predicted DNA-binding transcriptional regulator AlpA
MQPKLLNERDVAELLALDVRTIQNWRQRGGGPRFVRLGGAVRYRPSDIEAFVEAGMRCSTSDTGEERER